MRVLYLTEEPITFSGTMVRGGQIHVRNVVEGLRERDHDVTLVDWNDAPERPYQRSLAPRFRFGLDPARTLARAARVGWRTGADVVVSKTRKTYLPGLLAARALGVPHVVHVGSSPGGPGDGLADRLDTASVVARLRAGHDGYFVVCEALAADLERHGVDRSRVYDVKNAVDTARFHPERVPVELDAADRDRIEAVSEGRPVLGFVGGLHGYKGLDDFAAAVARAETDVAVVVAGDGPARDRLEDRFGEDAAFLGAVSYERIPAVYHAMDAFVLPSHTEGLPRVVLEAQATATPVVATRVGGVPEVVADGETGLLVDPHDPGGLADAFDALFADPERRAAFGRAGRAAVESSYSWDRLYERYERSLEQVVANAR